MISGDGCALGLHYSLAEEYVYIEEEKEVERGGPVSCWHHSTSLDSRLCSPIPKAG